MLALKAIRLDTPKGAKGRVYAMSHQIWPHAPVRSDDHHRKANSAQVEKTETLPKTGPRSSHGLITARTKKRRGPFQTFQRSTPRANQSTPTKALPQTITDQNAIKHRASETTWACKVDLANAKCKMQIAKRRAQTATQGCKVPRCKKHERLKVCTPKAPPNA